MRGCDAHSAAATQGGLLRWPTRSVGEAARGGANAAAGSCASVAAGSGASVAAGSGASVAAGSCASVAAGSGASVAAGSGAGAAMNAHHPRRHAWRAGALELGLAVARARIERSDERVAA
jgi:O-glycosyl hydrolase